MRDQRQATPHYPSPYILISGSRDEKREKLPDQRGRAGTFHPASRENNGTHAAHTSRLAHSAVKSEEKQDEFIGAIKCDALCYTISIFVLYKIIYIFILRDIKRFLEVVLRRNITTTTSSVGGLEFVVAIRKETVTYRCDKSLQHGRSVR